MACSAICPHACCVVGFDDPNRRAIAEPRRATGLAFCPCHMDRFDPRRPMGYDAESPEALRAAGRSERAAPGGA